jgi:hypothetical protein
VKRKIPEIRCPQLGHQVPLAYCYNMPEGRPCRRLLACWEEVLPRLRSVVAKEMGPEEWRRCFEAPPPSKLVTLADLIEKAKAG